VPEELHQRVMRALYREFVRRTDEGQARVSLAISAAAASAKPGAALIPVPTAVAAEGQAVNALEGVVDPLKIIRQHAGVTRPFLPLNVIGVASCMWVRPILTTVIPLICLGGKSLRAEAFTDGTRRCVTFTAAAMYIADGKTVVRGLRHVDVIIGMNRLLAAERACPARLAASVRDHFVHIHVELGAAAGHPDVKRENMS